LLCLSRQKFASNVVEKLLKYGNERHRCAIVREMLKVSTSPRHQICLESKNTGSHLAFLAVVLAESRGRGPVDDGSPHVIIVWQRR
jgi:hypothetical protein